MQSDQPRLLVVSGDGTWVAVPLPETGTLVFGRGEDADVRVDEKSVSRRHAKLEIRDGGRYALTDLGSVNGTTVNAKVVRGQTVEVKPQQPILFGQTAVVIQMPLETSVNEATLPVDSTKVVSAAMAQLEARIERVAPTLMNVLILGETGVGKDVLVERLHRLSPRANGPLLRLNCAGLPASLLESELFGHEKGAFTGALHTKKGLLETARGGTVLLDEIGEMPLEVQAKLLLVIEQRSLRRLSATQGMPIDVRFICATHKDLQSEVRDLRFRADFYFRINGITLRIPPLRERLEELESLVIQFVEEAAARLHLPKAPVFGLDAMCVLRRYAWPGNIRELRNIIDRAVVFSDRRVIGVPDLLAADLPMTSEPPAKPPSAYDAERESIVLALAECGGNQSRAAKLLGLSRNTLIARIHEYGLTRPRGR